MKVNSKFYSLCYSRYLAPGSCCTPGMNYEIILDVISFSSLLSDFQQFFLAFSQEFLNVFSRINQNEV
jgi:hypothetical protein